MSQKAPTPSRPTAPTAPPRHRFPASSNIHGREPQGDRGLSRMGDTMHLSYGTGNMTSNADAFLGSLRCALMAPALVDWTCMCLMRFAPPRPQRRGQTPLARASAGARTPSAPPQSPCMSQKGERSSASEWSGGPGTQTRPACCRGRWTPLPMPTCVAFSAHAAATATTGGARHHPHPSTHAGMTHGGLKAPWDRWPFLAMCALRLCASLVLPACTCSVKSV
jgi:hypothetical protein